MKLKPFNIKIQGNFEFDYDHEMRANIEVECTNNNLLFYIDFWAKAYTEYSHGDYYTPDYLEVREVVVDLWSFPTLFDENDEVINLTEEQEEELELAIKSELEDYLMYHGEFA